jgi:hypothetical protein
MLSLKMVDVKERVDVAAEFCSLACFYSLLKFIFPLIAFQASWWTVLQDRLLSGRAKSFPRRPSWAIPSMSALHCFQSQ